MNDTWILCSKESNEVDLNIRKQNFSYHEIWLDRLNLHETCWMLFADQDVHANKHFGWPGTEKNI